MTASICQALLNEAHRDGLEAVNDEPRQASSNGPAPCAAAPDILAVELSR
jgi:hypothetical protein